MFKGQRVVLRALKREDMSQQLVFESDPEQAILDSDQPRPKTLEGMLALYDRYNAQEQPNRVDFAIEADGKYIGLCNLRDADLNCRHCELGIAIGDRDYWGKGYGREVIGLLLDYAFRYMNMHRVFLTTNSDNERAIRCYRACGFIEEGRLRQHIWIDGHYVDEVYMGVLRDDALKSAP
jgi:RimJ/RimL family protein N-acetyltransferase